MKLQTRSLTLCALLGAALAFGGCDSDDDDDSGAAGAGGMAGGAGGGEAGAGGGEAGAGGETMGNMFTSQAAIDAFIEGKALVMEGDDIPSHPNGFDENFNAGQATQCYNRTQMVLGGGIFQVSSNLGTLNDAPEQGQVGTCDRDAVSNMLMFDSTGHSISNIEGNGECFDFDITYVGFAQEGRGRIAADGSTLELELFFQASATGHRCADGGVGEPTVMVGDVAFEGDAVQVYQIVEQ
ncbi:MAG: hypothetical protein ACE366_31010 [Bradymonadia bacterium]